MNENENKSEAEELLDDIETSEHSDGNAKNSGFDDAIEAIADENDEATVNEEAASLDVQLAEANDQILKLHAELDNVRKRVRREADDRVRFASLPLMQDLLQVFDNLKRGLDAAKKSESTEGLIEGVEMVAKLFEDTLGKHHCKPIPALGEVFDPNFHEAISQMPSDEFESGSVMLEATQGFQLHDRVVRPSQVIVSTGKAEA